MMTIIRHVFTAVLFTLLTSLVTSAVVLAAFPPDDWTLLFERKMYDVPFLIYLVSIPVVAGTIIGITTALYWQQRLQHIERQLQDVATGQKSTYDEPYKELDTIQQQVEQIQEKIRIQTENAQRLVRERADEREKSLQEIVVQERSRLARELHDSVSQQMFAASMMMSAINESNPPKDPHVQHQLAMVEKMIHQSQLEMRALLMHLRPAALKGKTLQEGAIELLRELEQKVP